MTTVFRRWLIRVFSAVLLLWASTEVSWAETAMVRNSTNAERFTEVCQSAWQALASVTQLREAPAYWEAALGPAPDGDAISQRFWLIAGLGLLVA
ncbi:MAG: hypothetical protein JOZ11_08430, partial [Alphaproteobacteria bacterium]|nr:hypothetical protein [Alphaproteobacteria bacterium]